jgi:DNA invertase Pin-like site-specific DNA recombinase
MNIEKSPFGVPIKEGNVTIYPAIPAEMRNATRRGKIRVAAYVRVSTDSAEQESSLILQKEYYENLIKNNPEYEFVGIYEDDGVSATSVLKRKGFLRLMEDCKAGKIDLILTKSISRFSRNVGDLLHYLNVLNALNPPVEIRFEMENISTFSPMGEMLIMVVGIVAQWESQNKSESITWAIDRRFANGEYYTPPILGYDKEKGRDNPLVINEEEAKTVRLCYALTAKGYSFLDIARILNSFELKNKRGYVCWTANRVRAVLSNEKNAGQLIARKTVTPNYKTHKSKKNEGEKPKYHDEKHHEPIVPLSAYQMATNVMKKRKGNARGIPHLQAVPKGILKGFVSVNKAVRGYTLNDYFEASDSVYDVKNNSETSILANEISNFDLRTYSTASGLLFDNYKKPSCSIKNGKITFNSTCRKAFGIEEAELLFHPEKAILALRSLVNEKGFSSISITQPVSLASFIPVALESAELKPEYQYRIFGTRRVKNGESIIFFDLRDAMIVFKEENRCMLPSKYAEHYGNEYYQNLAACDLHKIDIDGLWEALQKSKPTNSLAGDIVELNNFCQTSLDEFGFTEEQNNE